jgi:methyltransferase
MTRLAVCLFAIGCRLAELHFSRRNIRTYDAATEGAWSRRTYPVMVALHTVVLVSTLLFGRRHVSWPLLGLFVAAQPVRAWMLLTLGRRWNARGVVPAAMTPAANGPYGYVRHPNYAVVAVELFTLPAAFGLWALALLGSALNAWLLWLRISDEEALLAEVPGYAALFKDKPRFIPRFRSAPRQEPQQIAGAEVAET